MYGDSHALALKPAFDGASVDSNKQGAFAGYAGCPPLLGVYSMRPDRHLKDCKKLNEKIFKYVSSNKIKKVFLVARWSYYTDGNYDRTNFSHISKKDIFFSNKSNSREAFYFGLKNTLEKYNNIGVEVILVQQAPLQLYDPKFVYLKSLSKNNKDIDQQKLYTFAVDYKKHMSLQKFVRDKMNLLENKDYGPICATEVDKDNVMTKYGFCYDNKCSSNIFAGDTDGMGVTHKSHDIKPGRCCFPFIDNSKNNHKEYNECKETSRGPICATSTFDKDIPNKMKIKSVKKGQIKTKGYCPTKKYNLYTKRGKKCVLPFSFKDQLYNRCIDWKKKGKVCPIKKGANGTNIIGKKKGEDFDYCVDEDIDQIDKNEWIFHEGSVLSPKSKGPSILKSEKIFKTVKEAMDECKKKTNCKGVTDDFKTNKITMRWTDNPKKIDTFIGNSWTKK